MEIPTFLFVDATTGVPIDDVRVLAENPDKEFKVIIIPPSD